VKIVIVRDFRIVVKVVVSHKNKCGYPHKLTSYEKYIF